MSTIAENLQTIKDSTDAIKQAIIDKGGTISGDITTWASVIDSLPNEESSTEYDIDLGVTTENNVNVFNFLNGLLSSITCNGEAIEVIHLYSSDIDAIRIISSRNSMYDIFLRSDGLCYRSSGTGGAD